MRILMIGSGYVGLVSAACFAEMGNQVICLDIDEQKIAALSQGKVPFYEPGLEELVKKNIREKRLIFTSSYEYGVRESTVIFLALPTPSREDGSANISFLLQAAKEISKYMDTYRLIVNKSTAPIGTVHKIKETIHNSLQEQIKICDFDVASNPEFLKEGAAVQDCLKPDRIILGVENETAAQMLRKIYSGFMMSKERILEMDVRSAELTKYAANAMLASRISFMNEIASLCEYFDLDIHQIRKGIGSDSRIGHQFLYAGAGFGGSCFPKDLRALIQMAGSSQIDTPLLQAVYEVNRRQKMLLGKKITQYFSPKKGLDGKTIAIWGLSFKPNTDDIREAPSLTLLEMLQQTGAKLHLYDPIAMDNVKKIFPPSDKIIYCESESMAAKNADAVCLVTEWKQFRFIDLKEILASMKGRAFFDGRNQYSPEEMQSIGFEYIGIGIPKPNTALLEELLKEHAYR
ncbi:MAG: UDP-glucose/GDP-mannose dehydrogenase family protein [Simkaniaceae bacterium]